MFVDIDIKNNYNPVGVACL